MSKSFLKYTTVFLLVSVLSVAVFSKSRYSRKLAVDLTKKGHVLNNNSKKEIAYYESAIEADPTYSNAYYNLGNIYFDKQNYKKALKYFKRASSLKSSDSDYWYNLAITYLKVNEQIEAIKALKKALKANPKDEMALYVLSYIYFKSGSVSALNSARISLNKIKNTTKDPFLRQRASKLLQELYKKSARK